MLILSSHRRRLNVTSAVALCLSWSLSQAQSVDVDPGGVDRSESVVKLDPFKVTSETNTGYGAQFSSSSSRLNLAYIDVPQTVNVVTAEFLNDAFIFDSRDFSKFITGVTPRTNTHQAETYFIRGLQTTSSYVDGFLATVAVNRDSGLYDRIEYVKGPASAAIGRGEAGGLVNFVQKKPLGRKRVTVRATVGTDSFYRGELDYNDVLRADGSLSFRLPLYYEDSNGTRGGSLMQVEKYGIGPALTWTPFARTEINLNTAFFTNTTPGAVASAHWMHKDLVDMRVDQNGINPAVWYPGPNTPLVPFTNVYTYPDNFRRAKVAEGSLIINHKFSDNLSFRQGFRTERMVQNVVRYNTPPAVARNANLPSGYQITMAMVRNHNEDRGFRSQSDFLYELKWAHMKHSFLVGYDIYDNSGSSQQGTRSGITLDLYQPNLTPPSGWDATTFVAVNAQNDNKVEGAGYGYYGQYFGTFFDDRIQVMGGWRKDKSKARTMNLRAANPAWGNWRDETTDVPRYSISYKPTKWMSLYYVHSEQADPLRITNRWSPDILLNGATSYNDGRRPEAERVISQVEGYLNEFGVKGSLLGGRLTGSIAYFETGRNGFVQNEVRTEPGANGVGTIQYTESYLADGEKVTGFEFEVFGQPTPRLTLVFAAVDQKGTNPRANGVIQPIDALFDEISFHGKYSFRDRQRNGFEINGGGKYWFGGWTISNGSFVKFKDDQYTLNGGVSYFWKKGRFNVRAYGSNLLDDVIFITENSQYALRRLFLSFSAQY